MALIDEAEAEMMEGTGGAEQAIEPGSAAAAAAAQQRSARARQEAAAPPRDWDEPEPSGQTHRRRTRVYTPETRAAYDKAAADIKLQLQEGLSADDMDDLDLGQQERPALPEQKPAPRAEVAPAPDKPAPGATPPAPSLDPAVLEKRRELDQRAAELDQREQQLATRERDGEAQRIYDGYAERTVPTVIDLVKRSLGIDKDEDIKSEIADLVSALSGEVLGVELPPEVRAAMDNKRTKRLVLNHERRLTEREAALERKRIEAETTAQRGEAMRRLDAHFGSDEGKKQYPWLARESNAGQIVVEWIEGQMRRDGKDAKPMAWAEAAKLANQVLEQRTRKHYELRRDLLNNGTDQKPTTAKPAPVSTQQGDPAGIRGSRALTNAGASQPSGAEPAERAAPVDPLKNGRWSNDRYRAGVRRQLREAFRASKDE